MKLLPPFDRPVPTESPAMPPPWFEVNRRWVRNENRWQKDFLTLQLVGDESCVSIWASDGKRWSRDDEWYDHFSECEECRLGI